MNRLLASSAIAFACCGVVFNRDVHGQSTQPAAHPPTQPTEIPITAIKLFSSGVGYFERNGSVNGDDRTTLTFKTAQINDILKSLVLQDLDGGTPGTISYPSQDPIDRTLAGFSVDIASNPSLLDLLTQVRGSRITLTYGPDKITGVLLGTETKQRPAAEDKLPPIPQPVLNILDGTQIRAIPLDGVRDVQLDDPKLQRDLSAALLALAGAHNQEQKPVELEFHGKGERHVKIGYVVEAPVWKSSYRLVLDGDKPHLQGWAMVDNQTDADWNNVQLSLISGRPISFIENLYSPIYLSRQTVQPELYGGLQPPAADMGGVKVTDAMTPAAAQELAKSATPRANEGTLFGGGGSAAAIDPIASIAAVASTANLGELFSYTIDGVTLRRHESAMLPVVNNAIDAQRISLFNAGVLETHPLNGVRLNNTTGKHLLQGPVTVFDHGSYAGDSQVDNLPPGQSRILRYGIDLQVTIDANTATEEVAIQTATISHGLLHVKNQNRATHTFKIENKSDTLRTLVIEEPYRSNWSFFDTPKPVEQIPGFTRFQIDVPAGQATTFVVKQQLLTAEQIAIRTTDTTVLASYVSSEAVPNAVRDGLKKLASLKADVTATKNKIDHANAGIKSIADEQVRIRENVKSIEQQSDYHTRLMKKLNDQETSIEEDQANITTLEQQLREQNQILDDYIKNLDAD